jgi:hypothetical protein
MNQVFVKCPLDGHPTQKYCGLVEHYKDNGNTNECQYQRECHDMKTYIKCEKEDTNETI